MTKTVITLHVSIFDSYEKYFVLLTCVLYTFICLYAFLFVSHGVVSLMSFYEFDCPSGIFRPSFVTYTSMTSSLGLTDFQLLFVVIYYYPLVL